MPSEITSSPAARGSYEDLVKDVAVISRLQNPETTLLFDFAAGDSCADLNAKRERIAQIAGCSNGGRACFEGTPQQMP
jgi:hypothetical protein